MPKVFPRAPAVRTNAVRGCTPPVAHGTGPGRAFLHADPLVLCMRRSGSQLLPLFLFLISFSRVSTSAARIFPLTNSAPQEKLRGCFRTSLRDSDMIVDLREDSPQKNPTSAGAAVGNPRGGCGRGEAPLSWSPLNLACAARPPSFFNDRGRHDLADEVRYPGLFKELVMHGLPGKKEEHISMWSRLRGAGLDGEKLEKPKKKRSRRRQLIINMKKVACVFRGVL